MALGTSFYARLVSPAHFRSLHLCEGLRDYKSTSQRYESFSVSQTKISLGLLSLKDHDIPNVVKRCELCSIKNFSYLSTTYAL